jgi:hypothetical protein
VPPPPPPPFQSNPYPALHDPYLQFAPLPGPHLPPLPSPFFPLPPLPTSAAHIVVPPIPRHFEEQQAWAAREVGAAREAARPNEPGPSRVHDIVQQTRPGNAHQTRPVNVTRRDERRHRDDDRREREDSQLLHVRAEPSRRDRLRDAQEPRANRSRDRADRSDEQGRVSGRGRAPGSTTTRPRRAEERQTTTRRSTRDVEESRTVRPATERTATAAATTTRPRHRTTTTARYHGASLSLTYSR